MCKREGVHKDPKRNEIDGFGNFVCRFGWKPLEARRGAAPLRSGVSRRRSFSEAAFELGRRRVDCATVHYNPHMQEPRYSTLSPGILLFGL
jgi:hypothetical protein